MRGKKGWKEMTKGREVTSRERDEKVKRDIVYCLLVLRTLNTAL